MKRAYTLIEVLVVFVILAVLALNLTGCEGCQPIARSFGGTITVKLPPGKTLVSATWKQDSLWYLTRDRRPDEKPSTHTLEESSTFGMLEGKVHFTEQ